MQTFLLSSSKKLLCIINKLELELENKTLVISGFLSRLHCLKCMRGIWKLPFLLEILRGKFAPPPSPILENNKSNLQSKPLQGHPLNTEYGHLIITNSLLYPWGKNTLTFFSLNSTPLIRTPDNTDTFYGLLIVHIKEV